MNNLGRIRLFGVVSVELWKIKLVIEAIYV